MNDITKIAALKIVQNMNRVSEIWATKDYYTKHGALPEERNVVRRRIDEMTRAELISFCFSIHPTISKLKAKIAKTTDEALKAKLSDDLKIKQSELEELWKIRDEKID